MAFPLRCPVTNFLGNDDVFIGVLYCSFLFAEIYINRD